jgi:hypothetical protein
MTSLPRGLLLGLFLLGASTALAKKRTPPAQSGGRPAKNVPALSRPVKVDGVLADLKQGLELSPPEGGFTAQVGYRGTTLYLGLEIAADQAPEGKVQAEVALHFAQAGTTARGHIWRLGPDGLRPPGLELPAHAHRLTEVAVKADDGSWRLELAIPARALPRFSARDPLVFDLCVQVGALSNCKGGSMRGDALRLPEELRKQLKQKPPEDVVGLEGREAGWVGYAQLHYPVWVASDEPLTAQRLRELVGDERLASAEQAGINLPHELLLPGNRKVLSVLTGQNPYAEQGKCDGERELRFGLYLVQGRAATKVLEWPAATCALGRAVSFDLEDDGSLSIGYTNGATVTFQWFKDHFERTEIGQR